jgi:hypothetical protein
MKKVDDKLWLVDEKRQSSVQYVDRLQSKILSRWKTPTLPYVGLEASNLCMKSANILSRGMNIRTIPCSITLSIAVCASPPLLSHKQPLENSACEGKVNNKCLKLCWAHCWRAPN